MDAERIWPKGLLVLFIFFLLKVLRRLSKGIFSLLFWLIIYTYSENPLITFLLTIVYKGKRKEDISMATWKYMRLEGTTHKMSLISLWGHGCSTSNLLNIDHPSKILLFASFLHFSEFTLIPLRILVSSMDILSSLTHSLSSSASMLFSPIPLCN